MAKPKIKSLRKVSTLTIDRSRWLTGAVLRAVNNTLVNPGLSSSLLDPRTGLQCCLGFYSEKAGVPVSRLRDVSTPSDVIRNGDALYDVNAEDLIPTLKKRQWGKLCQIEDQLTGPNDAELLDASQRERRIAAGFRKVGCKVRFIGDAADAIAHARKALRIKA